jgi:hypothetical protein
MMRIAAPLLFRANNKRVLLHNKSQYITIYRWLMEFCPKPSGYHLVFRTIFGLVTPKVPRIPRSLFFSESELPVLVVLGNSQA